MCTDVEQQKQKLRLLQLNHVRGLITVLLLNPDIDLMHKLRVLNVATRELSDTPEQVRQSRLCAVVLRCVALCCVGRVGMHCVVLLCTVRLQWRNNHFTARTNDVAQHKQPLIDFCHLC